MQKTRCLGLIGGLGVGAAAHYYKELAKAHEARGQTLDLILAHAETSRVFAFVENGDRNGLAEYLNVFILRLQAAGAEIAVIPAITPHFAIRELTALSPLPLCNIFEPLLHELAARSIRRVAVFGTRYVMQSSLFGMAGTVQIVPSQPDEADYIHSVYTVLLQQGQGTEEQHTSLTALALELCERERLDAIILAGTDLALLFNESNTKFPFIDCAALHLQAIMDRLLATKVS